MKPFWIMIPEGFFAYDNILLSKDLGTHSIFCVRICVRKTFQNLLKLTKIGKGVENHT